MGDLKFFCAGFNKNFPPSSQIKNVLVNVPNDGKNQVMLDKTKTFLSKVNAQWTILDSGGFQIINSKIGRKVRHAPDKSLIFTEREINIAPEHIVNVAHHLSPTFVVALDDPILKLTAPSEQRIEFRKKFPRNLKWARETSILCKKFHLRSKLLIPLQCYTLEDLHKFLDSIGNYPFDGVCLPLRNQNPRLISEFLLEICRRNIRVVHLLGSSSFNNIALGAWFARNCFDWVSFDSTGWNWAASRGMQYLDPRNLRKYSFKNNSGPGNYLSGCDCPVCRKMSLDDISQTLSEDHTAGVRYLKSHNYHATVAATKFLFDLTKTPKSLLAYCESLPPQRGLNNFIETLKWLDSQKVPALTFRPMLKAA